MCSRVRLPGTITDFNVRDVIYPLPVDAEGSHVMCLVHCSHSVYLIAASMVDDADQIEGLSLFPELAV